MSIEWPQWANWIGIDTNGESCFFSEMPSLVDEKFWNCSGQCYIETGPKFAPPKLGPELYPKYWSEKLPKPIAPAPVFKDPVNAPPHYTEGGIEAIDYIAAKLGPEGFRAYCLGNVLKYVSRWQHKDGEQDLRKAAVYLGWAINGKQARQG